MPNKDETGRSPKIIRNTDEENAEIRRGIARDPDNPEWTAEEIKKARDAKEKGRPPIAIRPTDKEEAEIQRGIDQDPDNPEWTDEQFARARRNVELGTIGHNDDETRYVDLLLKYGDLLMRARAAAGSWEFVGRKLEEDVEAVERGRLPRLAKHFADRR